MYTMVTLHVDGSVFRDVLSQSPDLSTLQSAVNGFIEIVPLFEDYDDLRGGTAYANENGLIEGLQFNETATNAWLACLGDGPLIYEPRLHGNVVFVAETQE